MQMTIQIFLARLLAPQEFGLIGMLWIFTAIALSLVESGFGAALIQKKEVRNIDLNTVFYFNILVSAVLYALLFFGAPLIAGFYREPKLIALIRVISLGLIINAFGMVQTVRLARELDFRTQLKVRLSALALSGTTGIILAFKGFGVWSLAAQIILNHFLVTLFLWIWNRWRPGTDVSFSALKQLFPFGSRLAASGLLDTVFQNIYSLVIGKAFLAEQLGYYMQAFRIQQIPISHPDAAANQVAFPLFSRIQDDAEKLRKGYRLGMSLLVFVNFPLMLGLVVVAEPLVKVLLTDKWSSSIIYIQILSLGGMIHTLHSANLSILKVMGRSDIFLRLEVIKKVLMAVSILVGIRWGVLGLVIGYSIFSYASFAINSYYSGRLIRYSMLEQIKDFIPYVAASCLMAAFTYLVGSLIHEPLALRLAVQVLSGIASYVFFARVLRLPALHEAIEIIKRYSPSNKFAF